MKILQINRLGATLSTGRTTRELHNYLISHGDESFIACPLHEDCQDNFAFSSMNLLHINTAITCLTGMETANLWYPNQKLLKYIGRVKPDVVHLRILHSCGVDLGILLKYLAKHNIPTVITLHDFWFMTGKCPFYTLLNCDKWKHGCGNCPYHNKTGRKQLFDRSRTMIKQKEKWFCAIPHLAVIGVSDWVANEARQSILGNAEFVKRIYNWIDQDVFCPQNTTALREKLGLRDKYIILGVSSGWKLHDRKGLDVYLELAKIMPENYQIVLVGGGSPNLQLPSNVTLLPRTNSTQELVQMYSMADVYLNLSAEETFGKVSAEAVSCGTPVVAYDSTANKEIVPPNAGALVSELNAMDILVKIREIAINPKEHYIQTCRDFAKKNFDRDTNIREYIDLYHQLIESREKDS